MELYLNNEKKGTLEIDPRLTIGQLKKSLLEWINQLKNTYDIKFFFNNGEELDPIVFTSDAYDKINFKQQQELLKGGRILISQSNKSNQEINKTKEIHANTKLSIKTQNTKFTGMKDVDYLILKKLKDIDLVNICSVNKYLRSLCTEQFWKQRFEEKHPNFVNLENKTYKQLYLEELSSYNLYFTTHYDDSTYYKTLTYREYTYGRSQNGPYLYYIAKAAKNPDDILLVTNLDVRMRNRTKQLVTIIKNVYYPGLYHYIKIPSSPLFSYKTDLEEYNLETTGIKNSRKWNLVKFLFYP